MRKILIVGNWKMNLNVSQSSLLAHRLQEAVKMHKDIEVVLAPSMLSLQPLSLEIDRRKFKLAAQDAYFKDEGAYTGAVSFTMLRDLAHYCLVGHSERRHIFGETYDEITAKVTAAFRNDICPILCVGETNIERLNGETNQVLHDQIVTALAGATGEDIEKLVIAYEPVWSVDTGDYADPGQVEKAIRVICSNLEALYGDKATKKVRVLYGGSVNPDIASGYMRIKNIDGLLVGHDSINYKRFAEIIDAAYRKAHKLKSKGDDK